MILDQLACICLKKSQTIRQTSDFIGLGIRTLHKPNSDGLKHLSNTGVDKFVKGLNSSSEFQSEDEIVKYFKNLGIDVRLEDFTPKHFETFNLIRDDIELLSKIGLEETIPKCICLSDWRNVERTKQILNEYGLNIKFPLNRRAYCGASANTIFINSSDIAQASSGGVFKKFKHEIGHRRHYTHYASNGILGSNGSNSLLGNGVQDNIAFANKQLEILGINGKVCRVKNYPEQYQLTAPINNKLIPLESAKVLSVDLSKMLKYMNDKCHCYNKTLISEQVAEIFEDLLKGRRFDDLTMLMYDFAGGGRIPNLIINGSKYDDYIKSLYSNKELVDKLKEFISIT